MKTEQFDTVATATRYSLVKALLQFTKIEDFERELENAYHQLENDIWFQGIYISSDGVLTIQLSELEKQYCECCGPEMEYYSCESGELSTEQLREIVTYLNERLDIVCN
jgi:hypothetical protein